MLEESSYVWLTKHLPFWHSRWRRKFINMPLMKFHRYLLIDWAPIPPICSAAASTLPPSTAHDRPQARAVQNGEGKGLESGCSRRVLKYVWSLLFKQPETINDVKDFQILESGTYSNEKIRCADDQRCLKLVCC